MGMKKRECVIGGVDVVITLYFSFYSESCIMNLELFRFLRVSIRFGF